MLWAALYFKDNFFYEQATQLLYSELEEQILPDGAHYELTPMYHEILLDRLLDCINAAKYNMRLVRTDITDIQYHFKSGRFKFSITGFLQIFFYDLI